LNHLGAGEVVLALTIFNTSASAHSGILSTLSIPSSSSTDLRLDHVTLPCHFSIALRSDIALLAMLACATTSGACFSRKLFI
jgi:hypothetical protein